MLHFTREKNGQSVARERIELLYCIIASCHCKRQGNPQSPSPVQAIQRWRGRVKKKKNIHTWSKNGLKSQQGFKFEEGSSSLVSCHSYILTSRHSVLCPRAINHTWLVLSLFACCDGVTCFLFPNLQIRPRQGGCTEKAGPAQHAMPPSITRSHSAIHLPRAQVVAACSTS